jgi:hypothetical protein
MTLTLTWGCDACGLAQASKTADDPTFLRTPDGWGKARDGDDWRYTCPRCRRRTAGAAGGRVQRTGEVGR